MRDGKRGRVYASEDPIPIVKRSINLLGKRTSISLEAPFFDGLKEIAACKSMALSELIAEARATRKTENLSSAVRIYVLEYYRAAAISGPLIGRRHEARSTDSKAANRTG